MSADLEEIFARLGATADALPIGDAAAARQRGAQRRLRGTLTTGMAALLVVAVIVGIVVQGHRTVPPHPADPPPSVGPGLDFTPFRSVGTPSEPFMTRERYASVLTADGRSYAGWHHDENEADDKDGTIHLAATDLATGARIWGPITLPGLYRSWSGYRLVADVLVVIGQRSGNRMVDLELIAVDLATGTVRWQRDYGQGWTPLIVQGSVAVLPDGVRDVTEGVDLRTGAVRWSVGGAGVEGGTVAWESFGDRNFAGSDRGSGGLLQDYLRGSDQRVVQVLPGGRLRVLDATSGAVLSERAGLPAAQALNTEYVALDGMLYVSETNGTERPISRIPIVGFAALAEFYPFPAGTHNAASVTLCGPQLICLGQARDEQAELVGVDAVTGLVRWTRKAAPPIPATLDIQPLGDLILVTAGGHSALLDRAGNHLLGPALLDPTATWVDFRAAWIDSGNLLLWTGQDDYAVEVSVRALAIESGQVTELGRVRLQGSCSWDLQVIACPTGEGLLRWRYTAG